MNKKQNLEINTNQPLKNKQKKENKKWVMILSLHQGKKTKYIINN